MAEQTPPPALGKIALEEHVIFPSFVDYLVAGMPATGAAAQGELVAAMLDFGERRLSAMDAAGVSRAVLSISGPGVQIESDRSLAVARAQEANDLLAAEVAKRPDRYSAFAHLAMQAPDAAVLELERCVRELGFAGALVNGHTHGVYLDDPCYDPFWARLEALGVPLYLHPGDSYRLPHVFEGCPELVKPTWEWTTETSTHFLRLVFSGVFDRFPRLRVILGHMGEALPYCLWRLDSRAALITGKRPLAHPPSYYLRTNLFVTTSGQCDDVPLIAALGALGDEHVLFSVDYPYEDSATAGRFLDAARIDDATRAKVAFRNAAALLHVTA